MLDVVDAALRVGGLRAVGPAALVATIDMTTKVTAARLDTSQVIGVGAH